MIANMANINSFPGQNSYRNFRENGPCLGILEACQRRRVAAGRKGDVKEKSMKTIQSFWIKTFPKKKKNCTLSVSVNLF